MTLSALLHWAPLLLAPLLARALVRAPAGGERWSTRVDVPLALGVGVATSLLAGLWLVRFSLTIHPLTASDFEQYCVGVDLLRTGNTTGWPPQRSVAAGVLAGGLAGRLGVMDGLVVAAFASVAITGAGAYLWARAVGGRLAGLCAALALGAVGPVAALTRTVTFYPTTLAGFVLASATATAAMRWRTIPALFAAGVGASAALLLDVRGLLWALPAIGVSLVAALAGPWRGIAPRVLALAAPLALAWLAGPWAYPTGATSLEHQVAIWAEDALRRAGVQERLAMPVAGFLWGRSDLADLPATLTWLVELPGRLPAGLGRDHELNHVRHAIVGPWLLPLAAATALVTLVHARRRPLVLLALVGTALPFLAALQGATTVLGHARYVATALVFAPVVLGLAFEALATRRPVGGTGEDTVEAPRAAALRLGTGTAIFLLLLLGVVPSWLSPAASWRLPTEAASEPASLLDALAAGSGPGIDPRCMGALERDVAAGKGPRLFVAGASGE